MAEPGGPAPAAAASPAGELLRRRRGRSPPVPGDGAMGTHCLHKSALSSQVLKYSQHCLCFSLFLVYKKGNRSVWVHIPTCGLTVLITYQLDVYMPTPTPTFINWINGCINF